MNGKTHQLVGLTGGILTSAVLYKAGVFDVPACAATILGSSIGSYIPDIDHVGSVAGRKVAILSWPIKGLFHIFKWLHQKTKLKIFDTLSEMFTHRGIFHAPLFWFALFLPLFIFAIPAIEYEFAKLVVASLLFGLLLGIALHLFADMLNPTGVPLLMPFCNKKFRLARIVTGSGGELLFKLVMIIIFFVVALISFAIMQGR